MRQPPPPEAIARDVFDRYINQRVVPNVFRAGHVEAMVIAALGSEYALTTSWEGWDIEHRASRWRLEVKQSAAKQTWDSPTKRKPGQFDIKARTWYFDGVWLQQDPPKRVADAYVFAWHGDMTDACDQRDARQWQFLVLATPSLPPNQKTISHGSLSSLGKWTAWDALSDAVEQVRLGSSVVKPEQSLWVAPDN